MLWLFHKKLPHKFKIRYLYNKVDNNGKVHYTEIKVNPDNDGVNYVVTSGLKLGDKNCF